MSLPAAILAGGLATRLQPLTEHVPKALVEVAGKPFAVHQIELLRRYGVTEIVFCVGHLGELIEATFGDGHQWDVNLRYSFDGPTLLGTAGALHKASPLLGEAFFVLYGDSYLECDYTDIQRVFQASDKLGLMTVYRNSDLWDRSNVLFRSGELLRYDKAFPTPDMDYIDFGVAILRHAALERIPADRMFDLSTLYSTLVTEGQMIGYEVFQRFHEIGSPTGLEETRAYLHATEMGKMTYTQQHLEEARQIIVQLDANTIERMVGLLAELRARNGRLFFLGVGGSAANCSHAVNDFRKIAGIESYTPTDNISELTARTNDDGWASVFVEWLKGSRLRSEDMIFVFSVGGGNLQKNISPNLVSALQYAKQIGAQIIGVVGRDGGYTAQVADACVLIPIASPDNVTPHTEAFQAVVWHLLVSHPILKISPTKWESTK